jgi:hypothetical protein
MGVIMNANKIALEVMCEFSGKKATMLDIVLFLIHKGYIQDRKETVTMVEKGGTYYAEQDCTPSETEKGE